jgi:hypothetical protein
MEQSTVCSTVDGADIEEKGSRELRAAFHVPEVSDVYGTLFVQKSPAIGCGA